MLKATSLALACCLAVTPLILADGEEVDKSTLPDEKLVELYHSCLSRLAEAGLVQRRPDWDRTPALGRKERSTITGLIEIQLNGSLQIVFDAHTGECLKLTNTIASSLWNEQQSDDRTIAPQWDRERVLSTCEAVVRTVWGRFPLTLQLPSWYPSFPTTEEMRGRWRVEWTDTLNGYPYQIGGYGVSLHEEFGLIRCGWANVCDPCPTDANMTRPIALQQARAFIDKSFKGLGWDSVAEGITGLRSGNLQWRPDLPNGSLIIVKPSTLFDDLGGQGHKHATSTRTARLAYVIEFEPKEGHVPPGAVGGEPKIIEVFVDAATGDVIGGSSYFPPS